MAALVDLDGAQLACPIVNVLKQVVVNGLEMRKVECPDRCAFRDFVSH